MVAGRLDHSLQVLFFLILYLDIAMIRRLFATVDRDFDGYRVSSFSLSPSFYCLSLSFFLNIR